MYNTINRKIYNDLEKDIINNLHWIITETIKLGFNHDSRDSKKVDFLHQELITLLRNFINTDKYEIIQEGRVQGKIGEKDCDLVIINKSKFSTNTGVSLLELIEEGVNTNTIITNGALEVISVKNPISSYKKNAGNYTEALIGEAVNLKEVGIRYSHFMFLSDTLPIYKNGENGERIFLRKEEIGKKEIETFKKIKELSIIDDFVTFLYNIERYEEDFELSSDLIGADPGITLYTDDIDEIRYTFYFFEYLNGFFSRYS